MSVELKDDSIKVKAALNDATVKFLYEAAQVIPVSYTHLDVYKRQLLRRTDNSIPMETDMSGKQYFAEPLPVSYTHLKTCK